MLYSVLIRCIERENYSDKDEFKETLAILFASKQLTKDEYEELIQLIDVY